MLRHTSRSAHPDLLLPHCRDLCWAAAHYRQNEEIYGEAEEAAFVFRVVSGAVRTLKLLDDGRRQIGAFYLPADLFGLESGSTHMMTAEAVTDAKVMFLKRCALERAATHNIEVARWLLGLAAQRLDHLEEHVLLLGRKTAAERVAAFLLEMEQRLVATGVITLPMPRRDIADYLGLTIETVSRAITSFQSQGLVIRSKSREIEVQRRSELRAIDPEFVVSSRSTGVLLSRERCSVGAAA